MDSSVQESVVKGTLWEEGGGGGKRGRKWEEGEGGRKKEEDVVLG